MEPDQDPSDENAPRVAPSAHAGEMQGASVVGFLAQLTLTEKRVLHLISQSKTNREIAENLSISYATVKRHVENIFRKLNLRNRVEAAIYALSVQRCSNGNGVACPLERWPRKIRDEY